VTARSGLRNDVRKRTGIARSARARSRDESARDLHQLRVLCLAARLGDIVSFMTISRAALLVLTARVVCLAQGGTCTELSSAVQSTYNFKPSKLTGAQQKKKSAEMDKVWNLVEANPSEMVSCLITEMEQPGADKWFLFYAGSLLAKLDHSPRTNRLILRGCELVDLDDVALEDWVHRLTALALQDIDISGAAERWMRHNHASYFVPLHSFTARRPEGAFFLYGSMAEALAAPALLKIASDPAHPQRELALSLLGNLATSEADAAFRSVDLSGFPSQVRTAARSVIANRPIFERRDPPKSTREEILAILRSGADQRDFRPFMELVAKVSNGERDVVTVMKPEELPLIRKTRRAMAASGNPHLMEDYLYFTGIIWTLQQGH
jgi:hypothetical protein